MTQNAANNSSNTMPVLTHLSKNVESVEIDWSTRQRSVYWDSQLNCLLMIDQRDLPQSYKFVEHHTVESVFTSIKCMLVRGAPAIGAAGAFGLAIACRETTKSKPSINAEQLLDEIIMSKKYLDSSRPTAVNLEWATHRIAELCQMMLKHSIPVSQWSQHVLEEACSLADDDVKINKKLSDYGNSVIPQSANILHHCNTGCLATVDYGTALGVIYSAFHSKKNIHVYVDETRPRLQGAKLTAWELMREGVNMSLIVDSASGILMHNKKIDVIVYGADRVAANGDVANKIGTYNISCIASYSKIPVYACVPCSTIDLSTKSGDLIVIEERNSEEITHIGTTQIAPDNCKVYNPAFDVTPHSMLTGIITEEGICYPPFNESLRKAKESSEERIKQQWNKRLEHYLRK